MLLRVCGPVHMQAPGAPRGRERTGLQGCKAVAAKKADCRAEPGAAKGPGLQGRTGPGGTSEAAVPKPGGCERAQEPQPAQRS